MRPASLRLLLLLALPGCATIVHGANQNLTVTTNPPGASCRLERDGQVVGIANPTPATVRITKGKSDIVATCTREGHDPTTHNHISEFGGATFANVIAGRLGLQADLTDDGIFTLSEASRKLAAGVGEPVTIELFASRSDTRLSPYLQAYARRAEGLLRAYADASGGKIKLRVTDPQPDTEAETRAQRHGISGTRAEGGTAYLGVTAQQADTLRALPFLDPRRERFLEHDLSQLIASVTRLTRPRLALVTTLPISSDLPPGQQQEGPGDILIQELGRSFEVATLSNTATELPKDTAVVCLVHPHHLSPRLAYAVDQFLLNGGPVLALVDPLSRYQKFQQGSMPFMVVPAAAMGASSDPALVRGWGVDVPVDAVVGDAARSLMMPSPRGEPLRTPRPRGRGRRKGGLR